ncbi:MAG: YfhO family protein [Proteobacteria bacterium]|nr:YfhO family protein [Pseudomonadota bacterium]MBU1685723.1 YfhO family protein [Pseudomonadota bacterium]
MGHQPQETVHVSSLDWRHYLAFFALLVIIFYARFLFTGQFFLMRDAIFDFFARHQFYKVHLLQGVLPLWNPYTGGGEPFLSNLESAVFYPPNLLFLLFPVPLANVLLVVLHVFLAGAGVFLACRVWRVSAMGALLAAIGFAFSTQTVTRIEYFSFLCSYSWYPLAVASFALWVRKPTLRLFLVIAMILAMQLLAGYPEALLYTVGTLFIYGVTAGVIQYRQNQRGRLELIMPLLGLAGMGGIALVLTLVQILPVLDIIPFSQRASYIPFSNMASVNPAMLLTTLHPYLYGKPGYYGQYWAPSIFEFWVGTFYVGILPVVLCLTAAVCYLLEMSWGMKPPEGKWSVDVRLPFLLGLLIFSMLYSMGRYTPVFNFLWTHLEFLQGFRWPSKALMCVVFALCCCGGIAYDYLTTGVAQNQTSSRWRRRLLDLLPLLLWLPVGGFGLACLLDNGRLGKWMLIRFFNLGRVDQVYVFRVPWDLLADHTVVFVVIIGICAFLLWLNPRLVEKRARVVLSCLLALVLFADLMITTYPLLPASSLDIMSNNSRYLKDLGRGTQEKRFLRPLTQQVLYGVTNETVLQFARETMAGSWAMVDKVKNIRQMGDFKIEHYRQFMEMIDLRTVPTPYLGNILRLLKGSIEFDTSLKKEFYERGEISIPTIKEIGDSVPPAVVVGQVKTFSLRDVLVRELISGNHDLQAEALMMAGEGINANLLKEKEPIPHELIRFEERLNGLTIEVDSERKGLLVTGETFYPGWEAMVNGQSRRIFEVNGAFRAVMVPAGRSIVEMDYRPRTLALGMKVSLVSLALVIFLMIVGGPGTQKHPRQSRFWDLVRKGIADLDQKRGIG